MAIQNKSVSVWFTLVVNKKVSRVLSYCSGVT